MGRLTLHFAAQVDANEQARVLAALRKLKAKPRVRPSRGNAERWVFDTAPLPLPKPKKPQRYRRISDREWAKRYRTQMWTAIERAARSIPDHVGDPMAGWHDAVADWNHDSWTWERLTRLQGLVAAVAIARGCSAAVAPFSQTKGVGMPNNPQWESYESDLRELYEVAADLVAGRGGPEQYRARQSDPRLLMPAFGKTQLNVGVWQEPYGPLTAMCVAGFILHGTRFEDRFTRMGITGDLVDAYDLLERHYGPRCLDAPRTSTPSLAAALEAPRRSESFIKLALPKKPAPPLAAPPPRPALAGSPSRPALPDWEGRS
jgi:hypothetical protein